jgi:hypothetical protein
MLLDIIDNLPRLRMSSSQFKIILWLLKECRVKDVPSFNSFRKLQTKLRDACGTRPTAHTSSIGNIFYVNDVRESVARVGAHIYAAYYLYTDRHFKLFKFRTLRTQRS